MDDNSLMGWTVVGIFPVLLYVEDTGGRSNIVESVKFAYEQSKAIAIDHELDCWPIFVGTFAAYRTLSHQCVQFMKQQQGTKGHA